MYTADRQTGTLSKSFDQTKFPSTTAFIIASYTITWLLWIPVALSKKNVYEFPSILVALIGVYTPMLITMFFLYKCGKIRTFWKDLLDFRRIKMRWYAYVLGVPLALNGTAILVSLIFGDDLQHSEVLTMFRENPIAIVPYAIFLFILGPLPEELGWRGYLLERLQERWSVFTANFILGVLWLVWMLPLFFINGLYQHDELGFGSLGFWMFCIFIIAVSVVYAWVYNSTDRGLLAVVLFHFMFNFVGNILPLSPLADIVRTVLLVVLAIVVVLVGSPKTLASNLST